MATAHDILLDDGRPDVPDVIIFMTDGEANQPRNSQPCDYAVDRAIDAHDDAVGVYVIAYGVASARCGDDTSSSPYYRAFASTMAADMSSDDSDDNAPGGCASDENTDGDHYFCESGSSDLEPVFRAIAVDALERSRLIDF